MTFKKETPIEGGVGGCLCCGYQHDALPMDAVIAVGFGSASLIKDDQLIYDEQMVKDDEDYMTAQQAEDLALKEPDADWRIHLFGAMSERHYQRHGEKHWVLYEKGMGFA